MHPCAAVRMVTCFSRAPTLLISPATRGSFAVEVPCAIGTTIATSASAKRSQGSLACLMCYPSLSSSAGSKSGDYAVPGVMSRGIELTHDSSQERPRALRVDDGHQEIGRLPRQRRVEGRRQLGVGAPVRRVDVAHAGTLAAGNG